jgi:hypothetical protein
MPMDAVHGEVTRRVYMPAATVRRRFEEAEIAEALDEALRRVDQLETAPTRGTEGNHGD